MSIKQVHYDISPLLSKNAIFNIIYGEKSNREIVSSETLSD